MLTNDVPNVWRILRFNIQTLSHNWIFSVATSCVAITTLASLLLIALYWRNLPPAVPFWYIKPWGTERLASPGYLFLLPAVNIIWHIFYTAIGMKWEPRYRVFMQTAFLVSAFTSTLSLIIVAKIITLIT